MHNCPLHGCFAEIGEHTMTSGTLSKICFVCIVASIAWGSALAQGPLPNAPEPNMAAEPIAPVSYGPLSVDGGHKFWDNGNLVLFATSASLSAADFVVTRQNLESGARR